MTSVVDTRPQHGRTNGPARREPLRSPGVRGNTQQTRRPAPTSDVRHSRTARHQSIGAQTIGAQTIGAQTIGAQTIGAQTIGGRPRAGRLSLPALDRSGRHWNAEARVLLGISGLLTLIGLVFVLSASSVFSLSSTKSVWGIFLRQLQWEMLGFVVLAATTFLGVTVLRKMWWVLWGMTVLLLALVRLTPLGVTRNGSVRWIGPADYGIQPSELAKLAVVTSLAHMLSLRLDFTDWRVCLKYLAPFAVLPLLLVGAQPDLGTTSVIAVAAVSVLFAGGIDGRWLGGLTVGGGVLGAFSLHLNEYQWARVTAFIDPQSDAGFHIRRSLAGIAAGGPLGVGIGASKSKWGFLPNAHTDFIFSVIAEEVGLIGAAVVVGLFAAFAVLGVRIALRAPDRFSQLVAFGITGWIGAQAFANIAAVTGLAPVTGVPLPFVSQGGTAFVSLMAALGLLLDIARRGSNRQRTKAPHPSLRGKLGG